MSVWSMNISRTGNRRPMTKNFFFAQFMHCLYEKGETVREEERERERKTIGELSYQPKCFII